MKKPPARTGLTPPAGRVRLHLDAKSFAKVQLSIPPGEELEVSDGVAAQLVAGDPHFKPVAEPAPASDDDGAPASAAEVAEKPRGRRRSA